MPLYEILFKKLKRTKFDDIYIDSDSLEIDKIKIGVYVDINMLRDHGVKYYFSHIPLSDDEFKLVYKKNLMKIMVILFKNIFPISKDLFLVLMLIFMRI